MSENQTSELDTTELIGLVEGTVEELKDYVREKEFSDEQLQQILDAEKASENRKTAKKFLKQRIEINDSKDASVQESSSEDNLEQGKSEIAAETDLDREALLQMLGGTVKDVKKYVKENDPSDEQLQSLLHAEKMVKDRKTVAKFLKSYSKKRELEEDFHSAEADLKKLKQDLETIEENVLEDDVELNLEEIPEPDIEETEEKTAEESDEDEEETDSEEDTEESEETEEETDSKDEEDSDDSEENSEDGEQEDELSELEKKKQILKDMETELSEEELKQISIEELKSLKEEKEKREKLIERLSTKFDREQLEKMTTSDLEKLADDLGEESQTSMEAEREKKEQKKKDEEQLKEEAQEDLEMMMGAVKSDENEDDSGPGAVEQIKQLPDKFKGILSRDNGDDDEEETGFDKSKTIEVLEEYEEAEDREAAVKTAQVMKGYLEYALGIEREMTYAELADEMESRELASENVDTLIEFYRSMKISVYTGDVEADNIDEVIQASKAVVTELS